MFPHCTLGVVFKVTQSIFRMDQDRQNNLERILQNRKNRGASVGVPDSQPPQQMQANHSAAPLQVPPRVYTPAAAAVQPAASFSQPVFRQHDSQPTIASGSQMRSGSMVRLDGGKGSGAAPTIGAAPVGVTTPLALLQRKGTFDNFRDNPILVSSNIRSYAPPVHQYAPSGMSPTPEKRRPDEAAGTRRSPRRSPPAGRGVAHGGMQFGGHDDSVRGAPSMNAVAAASFSKPNPFRSQTFQEFCDAPHYDRNIVDDDVIPNHSRQHHAPSPIAAAMASPDNGTPPLFDPQQSIAVLSQGDWFLKWTRNETAHRRYVWLDLSRGVISWAAARDSSFFMQKSIKLEDIMDLQPICAVDDASGRTFYKLVIVSLDRVLKIGTELRDKFDVWFDTMQRLCEAQRTYTNTFIGRHAANNRLATAGEFIRHNVPTSSSE